MGRLALTGSARRGCIATLSIRRGSGRDGSRRAHAPRRADFAIDRRQGFGVADFEIFDREPGLFELGPAARRAPPRRRPAPPLVGGDAGSDAGEFGRAPPLLGRQIDVARRSASPSGSRTVATPSIRPGGRGRAPGAAPPSAADNPFRRNRRRRAGDWIKSLATTVATPSKWPARMRAAQPLAQPADPHQGRESAG